MLLTNDVETRQVVKKKAHALTRFYPDGCPYEVGGRMNLSVDRGGQQPEVYAKITIKSIRPVSKKDYAGRGAVEFKEMLNGEGWSHFRSWSANQENLYGRVQNASLYRISFDVEKIIS